MRTVTKVTLVHTTQLQPVQLPDKDWQKLALDIMGPFNDPKHKFVIVLVDYYSKWCEVAFETEVTTDKMIQFLDTVFAREGLPECFVTDSQNEGISKVKWHNSLDCIIVSSPN